MSYCTSVVEHVDTQTGLLRRRDLDQKAAVRQSAIRRWPF
jgi:hypothetical protein